MDSLTNFYLVQLIPDFKSSSQILANSYKPHHFHHLESELLVPGFRS
ncbi:MAG: hypothetical protein MGG11_06300 [Trichodesmium sp. MAG_R03]|nr:hypothetical protein [Trichodesmium sp. MAG_R03]